MEMKIPELKYGELPPNFKEITDEEFSKSIFFTYSSVREDWQRVGDTTYKIFWFHNGRCFAISENWKDSKKLRYWEGCLCEHEFERTNLGRCFNRYDCKKCGYSEEIDSSD